MIIISNIILLSFVSAETKVESLKKEFKKISLDQSQKFVARTKSTGAVTCPAIEPDASDCGAAVSGVSDLSTVIETDYSGQAVETAVNSYISKCKASQCQEGCSAVIAGKDLTDFNSFNFGTFASACSPPANPVTTSAVPACNASLTDNQTICNTSYNEATGNLTAVAWDPSAVKASLDSFVAACPTTSCKANCSSVISNKAISLRYSSLNTSFQANCKPIPPTPVPEPNQNSGIRLKRTSSLLIQLTTFIAIIQLLLWK